jgi:type I restriction enzyme, S subunit
MRRDWTASKIGEYCLVGDGAHAKIPRQEAGEMYLTSKNFKPEGLDLSKTDYISTPDFERHFRKGSKAVTMPEPSDVLVSIIGSLGEPYVVRPSDRFGLSSSVAIIRPQQDKLSPEYLFYWMKGSVFQSAVYGTKGGVAQSYLSLEMIRSLPLRFPALNVQRRIAEILSAYDGLIENNTRRIKILEEMAQMIYREWFVSIRFPGHDQVRTVQSHVGRIPAGWTSEPLENLCLRITDGSHWSPTTIGSTYRMASSKDMRRWGLDLSECRTISKEDYESLVRNDCRPLAGDVLITKDGANYLKYCFAVEKDLDVVLLSSVAMLRPREQSLSTYLSFHLRDPEVKARLSGRVSGAAIPRIVLTDFRHFRIMLPDLAIVRNFHDFVDPIVKLCCRLTESNQTLRTTRDLLLPKLISGEVSMENYEAEAVAQGV